MRWKCFYKRTLLSCYHSTHSQSPHHSHIDIADVSWEGFAFLSHAFASEGILTFEHYEYIFTYSFSVYVCKVASVVSDSLWPYGLYPARLLCPWDFPGKNTGMGCHALFQGIFLAQGSNTHLWHWQADSLPLSHLGNPQTGLEIPSKSHILTESLL